MSTEHNKFKTLCESVTTRLQNRGILVGDYVTFKKDAFKSDWMKEQAQSVLQKIASYVDGEKPVLLKVFMIKTPISQTYGPTAAGEDTMYLPLTADIGVEPSPGLCTDVMTVPIHLLEVINVGELNMLPKEYVKAMEKEGAKHLKRNNKDSLTANQKLTGIG